MPNAPAVSWARIVTPPRGTTWWAWIRIASPTSITPSSAPSEISVRCAVRTRGSRKAGTPLAIASTPVTAEQPEANAFSSRTIPSAVVGWIGPRFEPMRATGWGWNAPTTIVARMLTMKTAVGAISSFADSAMPNMLTAVSSARPASETSSRWCASAGKTLPRLAAPAARLTATVST